MTAIEAKPESKVLEYMLFLTESKKKSNSDQFVKFLAYIIQSRESSQTQYKHKWVWLLFQ